MLSGPALKKIRMDRFANIDRKRVNKPDPVNFVVFKGKLEREKDEEKKE
jgi:hypothetical protein